MLSQEQVEKIKKELLQQVERANVPNKKELTDSIKAMNSEELEDFINRQNASQTQECIFCSIIDSKIPSYKIGENAEAIAVLEINPISRGHSIIIPKIHSDKTPPASIQLAKEISEKIKALKPKSVEVIPSTVMGHGILNVLPVYDNETMSSPKKRAEEKELQETYLILTNKKETSDKGKDKSSKPKKPRKPRTKKLNDKKMWLPRRTP